jgi:hypothetical protein
MYAEQFSPKRGWGEWYEVLRRYGVVAAANRGDKVKEWDTPKLALAGITIKHGNKKSDADMASDNRYVRGQSFASKCQMRRMFERMASQTKEQRERADLKTDAG